MKQMKRCMVFDLLDSGDYWFWNNLQEVRSEFK
jgi:hypothetical protein